MLDFLLETFIQEALQSAEDDEFSDAVQGQHQQMLVEDLQESVRRVMRQLQQEQQLLLLQQQKRDAATVQEDSESSDNGRINNNLKQMKKKKIQSLVEKAESCDDNGSIFSNSKPLKKKTKIRSLVEMENDWLWSGMLPKLVQQLCDARLQAERGQAQLNALQQVMAASLGHSSTEQEVQPFDTLKLFSPAEVGPSLRSSLVPKRSQKEEEEQKSPANDSNNHDDHDHHVGATPIVTAAADKKGSSGSSSSSDSDNDGTLKAGRGCEDRPHEETRKTRRRRWWSSLKSRFGNRHHH
jgi:hypothetical protein